MPNATPPFPLPLPFHATTANSLDGYQVTDTLGIVRGITVRSRSVIGTFGAALQRPFGPPGNGSPSRPDAEYALISFPSRWFARRKTRSIPPFRFGSAKIQPHPPILQMFLRKNSNFFSWGGRWVLP